MVPLTLGDALTVSLAPRGATDDSLRISGLPLSATPDNLVLRAIGATRAAVGEGGLGAAVRLRDWPPGWSSGSPGGGSRWGQQRRGSGRGCRPGRVERNAHRAAGHGRGRVPGLGRAVLPGPWRGPRHRPGRVRGAAAPVSGRAAGGAAGHAGQAISTAAVFTAFAGGPRPPPPAGSAPGALAVSENLAAAMRSGLASSGLLGLAESLAGANDLLPAAQSLAPDLLDFMRALGKLLGRPVGQSGSGPTLWVLYRSLPEARKPPGSCVWGCWTAGSRERKGRGVRRSDVDGRPSRRFSNREPRPGRGSRPLRRPSSHRSQWFRRVGRPPAWMGGRVSRTEWR